MSPYSPADREGGREKREKKAVNAPAGTRGCWRRGARGGQGKVGALQWGVKDSQEERWE